MNDTVPFEATASNIQRHKQLKELYCPKCGLELSDFNTGHKCYPVAELVQYDDQNMEEMYTVEMESANLEYQVSDCGRN